MHSQSRPNGEIRGQLIDVQLFSGLGASNQFAFLRTFAGLNEAGHFTVRPFGEEVLGDFSSIALGSAREIQWNETVDAAELAETVRRMLRNAYAIHDATVSLARSPSG